MLTSGVLGHKDVPLKPVSPSRYPVLFGMEGEMVRDMNFQHVIYKKIKWWNKHKNVLVQNLRKIF